VSSAVAPQLQEVDNYPGDPLAAATQWAHHAAIAGIDPLQRSQFQFGCTIQQCKAVRKWSFPNYNASAKQKGGNVFATFMTCPGCVGAPAD
jgi:hypothetical protein